MVFTYLVVYCHHIRPREIEYTGSFFHYADKKISDCELTNAKEFANSIANAAKEDYRKRGYTMVESVAIVDIKLLE